MSTPMVLAVLVAWYAPAFAVAAVMARRGHDPLAWSFAAWIGGWLVLPAALLSARTSHAAPSTHPAPEVDITVDLTTPEREPVTHRR